MAAVRAFVAAGGGLIGVGDPSAHVAGGVTYQLADVLGVDRELGWGLSTAHPVGDPVDHFITRDLTGPLDVGEGTPDVIPVTADLEVLASRHDQVLAAARTSGAGRAVYLAGLPYDATNSRLLHRALWWAAGREDQFDDWAADDPAAEVAYYPRSRQLLVLNNSADELTTRVRAAGRTLDVTLTPRGRRWVSIDPMDD